MNYLTLRQEIGDACRNGDCKTVDLLIERVISTDTVIDFNYALYCACSGGHISLVKQMIEKGANDFNGGLWGACYYAHKEIVELMIEKGANDFNVGIYWACYGGHSEIVKLLIEKGTSTNRSLNFNEGLQGACRSGHNDLIMLMIEKGATNYNDFDIAKQMKEEFDKKNDKNILTEFSQLKEQNVVVINQKIKEYENSISKLKECVNKLTSVIMILINQY